MWPVLLNMTRDDCRRTLRSLELEAYSNMISVFRAQGPLEETRKKLLEDLRSILNISNDRHSAEARRVANDELLATIAEKLVGPHTNLDWISEGRRLVPLMPRGIPQTAFTELADQVSEASRAENKELQKKLEAVKSSKSNDMELTDVEDEAAEETINYNDEMLYPPIVMEDHSPKIWETELIARKRKVIDDIDDGVGSDDDSPPMKNLRNSPVHQKHLNLAQLYSKFSQPTSGKTSSHTKHSYNQVSKVSTSKSNSSHPQERRKHVRAPKNYKKAAQVTVPKSQSKKRPEPYLSPSKLTPHDYGGPPGSFQATYAQTVMGAKPDYMDNPKPESSPAIPTDSPTLQLLTAPPVLTHEARADHPPLPATPQPRPVPATKHIAAGKPCELIIKRHGDVTVVEKNNIPEKSPKTEPVKVSSNRPILVTSSHTPKIISASAKFLPTKIIGPAKSPSTPTVLTNKMIVVSKSSDHRSLNASKFVIATAPLTPTLSRETSSVAGGHSSPRLTESIVAKGIPATDVRVSSKTKTFLLNPKSGQKMHVVVPGKPRTIVDPFLPSHSKSFPLTVKPIASVPRVAQVPRTVANVTPKSTMVSLPTSSPNFGHTPIKTANMADIVPVKGLPPTPARIASPIVRPSVGKGGVIVVQKGTTIGKTIAFKNGGETKIIMGKNVNQLIQASKNDTEAKGNVIVLELNNERTACGTSMSDILEAAKSEMRPEMRSELRPELRPSSQTECPPKRSCVTDWELELDAAVPPKHKDLDEHEDDDKLNSMHLDLGMSSDSEGDSSQDAIRQSITPSGESGEIIFDAPSELSHTGRDILCQIQDDVTCSIDSAFGLSKTKLSVIDKAKRSPKLDSPSDKSETEELNKAKEKLSEKVAKSVQNRIDLFSTAITKSEINFDSYLEENIIEDEIFSEESTSKCPNKESTLDISELLTDSTHSDTISQ